MTRLNVSKAREEFPEVVNRAAYGKERTIVSRRGKDLAAVIPMDDLRLLERLAREEMNRIDLEAPGAALAEPGENIPLEQVKAELGLAESARTSKGRSRRAADETQCDRLAKLDQFIRRKVLADIEKLAEIPRAQGYVFIESKENLYRVYIGPGKNYRALYQIQDEILLVLVVNVGDRKEIYRRLK